MPRAEKSTEELKKDFERAKEKYERAVEKDNRKIADIVHKHYGESVDLERLDTHFGMVASSYATTPLSSKDSPARRDRNGTKKVATDEEHKEPTDGTGENGN